MVSEVQCKVGNHTYIYQSTSYRNQKGQPRNKRTTIGKINPTTGQKIYKPQYINKMKNAGTPLPTSETQPQYSIKDIKQSTILEYGLTNLLQKIAKQTGLYQSLQTACPKHAHQIYALANHLVANGDPYMHAQEWLNGVDNLKDTDNLSSQRISEILTDITFQQRETFYQQWCTHRSETEYLALDITSTSSYSELIEDVEWGYNRDEENLAQINLCMLMGETSRLPIYQTVYSGSLRDVSTLKTTLAKFETIAGDKPILVVMDKGFASKKNITGLLEANKKFVIAMPFTFAFTQQQIAKERETVDCLKNVLVMGGESLRAVTKRVFWGDVGYEVFVHVFFNPVRAVNDRERIFAGVLEMQKKAVVEPLKYVDDVLYQRYLSFEQVGVSGYMVEVRADVVESAYRNAGWLVIVSNEVELAVEALRIYRAKDVVEKGFLCLKNSLDVGRLRVHGDEAVQNKVFIGFVALILLSYIHNVMLASGLYRKWTLKQLLRVLAKHRVIEFKGSKIFYPVTKDQRLIYQEFGIPVPE
jgi:hypothetical protein